MTNVESLVAEYIGKRNALAEERKAFEEKERAVKEEMAAIEAQLLEISEATGVDSFKTSSGTAFRTTKSYVSLQDWQAFADYVIEKKALHLVEKRPSKLAVLELLKESPELAPDDLGVAVAFEQVIQFRK